MEKCNLCEKEIGKHIIRIVEEIRYGDKSKKIENMLFKCHVGCFNEWVDKKNVRN